VDDLREVNTRIYVEGWIHMPWCMVQ
jgi:hypothetical protein